jgi:hypothetical protein
MATRNPITNDEIKSKSLSKEGKSNFDEIFGKRDWRNRPMPDEEVTKVKKK